MTSGTTVQVLLWLTLSFLILFAFGVWRMFHNTGVMNTASSAANKKEGSNAGDDDREAARKKRLEERRKRMENK